MRNQQERQSVIRQRGHTDDLVAGSTMSQVRGRYFNWLARQINLQGEHIGLYRCLHSREFFWDVPNDDNRLVDGMEVRKRWYANRGAVAPENWPSVLEVIVALSQRLEFQAGGYAQEWAAQLIRNLGLDKYEDPITSRDEEKISEALDALIFRTYERNGSGGFFPLRHTEHDQTKIEIWYQMAEYIREHHLV